MNSLAVECVKSIVSSLQSSSHSALVNVPQSLPSDSRTDAVSILRDAFTDCAIVSCKGDQIHVEWGSRESEVAKACGRLMRKFFSFKRKALDYEAGPLSSDLGGLGCSMLERIFTTARIKASSTSSDKEGQIQGPQLPSLSSEGVRAHVASTVGGGAERALASWLLRPSQPSGPLNPFSLVPKVLHQGADWETMKPLVPFFWSVEWESFQQSDPRQGQAFVTLTDGHCIFLCICIRSIPMVKRKKTGAVTALVGRLGMRALAEMRSQAGRGAGKSTAGSSEEVAMQRRRHKRWSVARAALDHAKTLIRDEKLPQGSLLFSALLTSEMEGVQITSREKEGKAREEAVMLTLLGNEGCAWPATPSINVCKETKPSGKRHRKKGGRVQSRGGEEAFSTLLLSWVGGTAVNKRMLAIGSILILSGATACFIYQSSVSRRWMRWV
jgi:hypothetical protein